MAAYRGTPSRSAADSSAADSSARSASAAGSGPCPGSGGGAAVRACMAMSGRARRTIRYCCGVKAPRAKAASASAIATASAAAAPAASPAWARAMAAAALASQARASSPSPANWPAAASSASRPAVDRFRPRPGPLPVQLGGHVRGQVLAAGRDLFPGLAGMRVTVLAQLPGSRHQILQAGRWLGIGVGIGIGLPDGMATLSGAPDGSSSGGSLASGGWPSRWCTCSRHVVVPLRTSNRSHRNWISCSTSQPGLRRCRGPAAGRLAPDRSGGVAARTPRPRTPARTPRWPRSPLIRERSSRPGQPARVLGRDLQAPGLVPGQRAELEVLTQGGLLAELAPDQQIPGRWASRAWSSRPAWVSGSRARPRTRSGCSAHR